MGHLLLKSTNIIISVLLGLRKLGEIVDDMGVGLVYSIFLDLLLYELTSHKKRKETLTSMCHEKARMLQDQFNFSMNHIQAMSMLTLTFHYAEKFLCH